MARVALREKIVVGLMMEGVSWVSMVVVTGWVVVCRERFGKEEKIRGMVEYVNDGYTVQNAGRRDVRWTPHF